MPRLARSVFADIHRRSNRRKGVFFTDDESCERFGVYSGVPAKRLKRRKINLLELEREFKQMDNS